MAAAAVSLALAAAAAVGAGVAGAQGTTGDGVPLGEVVKRDELIFNQEALLNVYRCLFGVDTQVVPGGCADGAPARPAEQPAPFAGQPTLAAVAVRDHLVESQEALLNVYRCLFGVDVQIVPGGCVDGKPFDPAAPPAASDPSGPPAVPTGFEPGDSGAGWTVDANGRVALSRLMTAAEGAAVYRAAGYSQEVAERVWSVVASGKGWVGGISGPRGARYHYDTPMAGLGADRVLEWARACVAAYEDAGVPGYARSLPADYRLTRRIPATPAGLAGMCARQPIESGGWDHVVGILNADPECIYEHIIEFMPIRARVAAGVSYADMGHSRFDFWWGNHCAMSVSHPLGSELVLGPFGGFDEWTYDVYDQLAGALTGDWSPAFQGTERTTGRGRPRELRGPRRGAPPVHPRLHPPNPPGGQRRYRRMGAGDRAVDHRRARPPRRPLAPDRTGREAAGGVAAGVDAVPPRPAPPRARPQLARLPVRPVHRVAPPPGTMASGAAKRAGAVRSPGA